MSLEFHILILDSNPDVQQEEEFKFVIQSFSLEPCFWAYWCYSLTIQDRKCAYQKKNIFLGLMEIGSLLIILLEKKNADSTFSPKSVQRPRASH